MAVAKSEHATKTTKPTDRPALGITVSWIPDNYRPASRWSGPLSRWRKTSASPRGLKRVRAAFAGADAHGLLDAGDEDLAVADLAGVGGLLDGLDRALDLGVVDHDL